MAELEIRNLHVRAGEKDILRGVDLSVGKGEIHALMGPNGSGKSTLANAIMGHPSLEITEGQIFFNGEDVTEADPDERARMGLFMAFQYPVALPGVTVTKYLRTVLNAHREARGQEPIPLKEFRQTVEAAMKLTNVPKEVSSRYLNEGFSGGEKERMEILQLAVQQPGTAVLDGTDAMPRYYTEYRASIHRGVYPLAVEATDAYEGARRKLADWLGSTPEETVFTANATAAINLVAYTWGRQNVHRGDLVVLTEMEHHSNIVPWQILCQDREAELAYVPLTDDGQLDLEAFDGLMKRGPKLVAVAHVSNVVGTINPVETIVRRAHEAGAVVLIDGAQAVPQLPVDLNAIDADFYAWTGHKTYGPTGIGVLHGRRELLEEMPPFIAGGHMIRMVGDTESTWTDLPWKFEAGTSQIAEAIGLGAAVDWIQSIGIERVRAHDRALVAETLQRLTSD